MDEEFKVLKFPNTSKGQEDKVQALKEASRKGWAVVSETVTSDTFDEGGAAMHSTALCCLCGPWCAPFGFLGKKKAGSIAVTFSRSAEEARRCREEEQSRQEEEQKIRFADRQMADIARIVAQYRDEKPGATLSPYLLSAAKDYIDKHRKLGGPIPCLSKCTREEGKILIRDSSGRALKTYSRAELQRLQSVSPDDFP